jgi:lipoprotein-releasing system permease protein
MKMPLLARIAFSLMQARWRQSLIAAIGVTFGIAMFITLLSFMTGLNDLLDGLVLNRTPHVRIYKDIKPNEQQPIQMVDEMPDAYHFVQSVKSGNSRQSIFNSKSLITAVLADERVEGLSPKVTTPVFFNDGQVEISGVINGIDPIAEARFYHFDDYIRAGKSGDIQFVPNSIILGKGLAEKLLAEVGDMVQTTTPRGDRFTLKVVGIYQSGLLDYDKAISFTSVKTVQKILQKPSDYLTEIQVKLRDLNLAPAVASEYRRTYKVDAEDIQTANAQFETGSFVRTLISYAVGITLLVVAGFGIYNILNMMIYEKMDSIAILKATGFAGRDVRSIFILIALTIGFLGGLLGLLIGFALSVGIDFIPFNTPSLPTIKTYPINYDPVFYLIGALFSLITTYLAGLFPARKASKIDPVIIIRGK